MTRAEHRRLAETLVANAWRRDGPDGDVLIQTPERRKEMIETAAVHAELGKEPSIVIICLVPVQWTHE